MPLDGGNLTRDEAAQRAELVDDLHYDVRLDLRDPKADRFTSYTDIRFTSTDPHAPLFLDLTAHAVEHLVVNGREADLGERFDGTRLHLEGLEEHNRLEITATCGYERSGVGLHRFVDPEDGAVYLHTQFEPFDAHRVFACFDQPDIKARFRLTVDAPEDTVLVSNTAVARADGSRRVFAETPLLPTYLVALVAGPMHVVREEHDGIPLALACRESMARYLEPEELFDLTRRGLDHFREVFDQPYPFSKYDQLYVPEFTFGAMENPGCITFSEHYLFRGQVTEAERESRANTLLHEMAHMWFGDLVTMRWWDDLWLNESFATFMATLACERATRFTNAWVTFSNEEKAWARKQDQLPTTHPISTDASDLHTVLQNFDGITYAKGASVLRQLVAWVGEDAFLDGVRAYFRRYAWGNAELADLLTELEETSGRELDDWAKTWLRTSGMNTVRVRPEVTDGRYEAIRVEQDAPAEHPTLRPHRLAVGLFDRDDAGLTRRTAEELDVTGATTAVTALAGEAHADLILPNDRDLAFVKVELDERSLATIEEQLAGLADPLARTLCWTALWEMVRDAELPAGRFVAITGANIHGETDIGVLQTLNARVRAAVELYGDPTNAAPLSAVLARDARSAMERSEPGGDVQLAWARQWIATATEADQLAEARRLLDGELVVDGLSVDTELRWHVVGSLAAAGAIGEAEIAAELERDPSDAGERRAAAARAARPEPDVKAAAWERVIEDQDLSHSMMKAVMRGFMQRDQADLLRPYVERYFGVLDRVWSERQREVAMDITEYLYPTPVVEQETVRATDTHLERDDLPPLQRRTILEERDTVVRAVRTRALDAGAQPSTR